MTLEVTTRELDSNTAVIEIQGDIDFYSSAELKDILENAIEKGKHRLIIQLEKVEFIDTAGIGVLVGRLGPARQRGGDVVLVSSRPQVKKVFQMTGLLQAFRFFDAMDEAIAGVANPVESR